MPTGKNSIVIVYWEGNAAFAINKLSNESVEKGLAEHTDCNVRVMDDVSRIDFRRQDLHEVEVILTDRDSEDNGENEIRHHVELLRVSTY